MVFSIIFIIVGLALLGAGGELLLRGASSIATLARMSPVVIGLTVVAAGTSMPELVVSVQAAMAGSPDLSVGNVVGSNIFNIVAILGVAALITPLRIHGNTVRLEWPLMFLALCQLHLLARDGVIDRLEGGFFALALVLFVVYVVRIARREASPAETAEFAALTATALGGSGARAWMTSLAALLAGVALLVLGSSSLVRGAVELARLAGLSETIIGLTIVAAGTSLPELAASAVASWRGRDDIAVANVIGSNLFNVLGILGVTALVRPLPVSDVIIERDGWWMLGFGLLLLPIIYSGNRVRRSEGLLLLAGFVVYLSVLVMSIYK